MQTNLRPTARHKHPSNELEAAAGAVIGSIAAPGSGASAIFDDFVLTQPGDGEGYAPTEYAVAGTSGEGCLVSYWPD